jgi:ADP-ribose pyrophosphatase
LKYIEKTISTKNIFKGKIIKLRVDEVILNNDNKATREIVEHSGAVAIIPIIDKDRMFLVRQFRKPIEKELIELPAGKLEREENPKECALRELEEEIGYRAGKIQKLITIYTSPGFANEIIHIYVASDLKKTRINRDKDEFMDILKVSFEEVKDMINNGKIQDAKTIAGVLAFFSK